MVVEDFVLDLSVQVVTIDVLVRAVWHLTEWIMCIADNMLMTVQIQIELMVLEHGEEVEDDIGEVWVPLSPHRMMKYGSFPEHIFVRVPLDHGLVDPLVHLVTLSGCDGVVTNHISQALVLGVEKHMTA